jgi:sugar-specific transcriptional regulator TrmB
MDTLINLLKNYDFTESESKAYISLLQSGAKTGYEVSKMSGVPRSKIYNVLETLTGRGVVMAAQDGKSLVYSALPVDELVSLLRGRSENTLKEIETQLSRFDYELSGEQIWKIRGYDSILNKCLQMISAAKEQVLMQVWARDLTPRLEDALVNKENELNRVLLVLYDTEGIYRTNVKHHYRHGFEKDKIAEMGGQWITLATDNRQMLYASLKNTSVAQGIVTKNPAMVFFAAEYVIHDAYSLRLIEALGDNVKNVFGSDMEGVRNVFKMR